MTPEARVRAFLTQRRKMVHPNTRGGLDPNIIGSANLCDLLVEDIERLLAVADRARAFVDEYEEERRFKGDGEFPAEQYQALRAALPKDPWEPVLAGGDTYITTECYSCHADWDFGARQHKPDCKWVAVQ